jgi:peptide/nickel transport system permease protein
MPRRYLLGRIAQAALVLWAAFTASFILLQLLPGDAVLIKFLNPELGLGPQEIADIRAAYGADQPVWQQYLHTLAQFLTGHFGYSLQAGVPVSQGLATSLPPTLRLAALGFPRRRCWPSLWRPRPASRLWPGCAMPCKPCPRSSSPCPFSGWASC